MKESHLTWIKYLGTLLVLTACLLAATQHIPYNFLASALSTLPWIFVAITKKDWPLLIVNLIVGSSAILAFAGYGY